MKDDKITVTRSDLCISTRAIYFNRRPVNGVGGGQHITSTVLWASPFCPIKLSTCLVWGTWCICAYLVRVSVSEPPSSDANGTFFYILCVVHRAAYPKVIQFNARNVYKIRIVQTPRVLKWSRTAILQQESPSHQGTEKTDCSVEKSEIELVVPLKPRHRERNGWECMMHMRIPCRGERERAPF